MKMASPADLGPFAFELALGEPIEATGANLTDWMARLDGSKRLSELTIPGTHDSGALHEPIPSLAQCQNLQIAAQLGIGVRFLDIRCVNINDSFAVFHGIIDQQLAFDSVLNDCLAFLRTHKGETIIMSIQKERDDDNCTKSFEQVFDSYTARAPDLWFLKDTLPSLDDTRGKIVLLRRFDALTLPKGIAASPSDWKDNQTFSIPGATEIRVQDQYRLDDEKDKWPAIRALLQEAFNGKPDALYLNFTSAYVKRPLFNIPDIRRASNVVNPATYLYFDTATSGRYGVIIMDFVDQPKCEKIIATNAVFTEGRK